MQAKILICKACKRRLRADWSSINDRFLYYCITPDCIEYCELVLESDSKDEILVEVRGGVAYCDDERVTIIDYDNH